MQEILIIRFGALGDLCLLGWTLARLAAAPDRAERRVTLVTKQRLTGLAVHLTGVDQVVSLREPGGLRSLVRLAGSLRRRKFCIVIDAHAVLRSRLLLGMLGLRPDASLRKDTVARLRLLRGGGEVDPSLRRHMRDRFDALLDEAGLPGGRTSDPCTHPVGPPLAALAASRAAVAPVVHDAQAASAAPAGHTSDVAHHIRLTHDARQADRLAAASPAVLGLAPGAQWDTKRWPPEHWAELVRRYRSVSTDPMRVFLGPREQAWFKGSELAAALASNDTAAGPVQIVCDRPLPEVAALLGGCRILVCNDSGLMHLAEAVGTPVVACFGPTVAAFGYTPRLPGSTVLEIDDLDCRPCSRNGKRPCHRADLACLQRITPARVWSAVCARGPWPED